MHACNGCLQTLGGNGSVRQPQYVCIRYIYHIHASMEYKNVVSCVCVGRAVGGGWCGLSMRVCFIFSIYSNVCSPYLLHFPMVGWFDYVAGFCRNSTSWVHWSHQQRYGYDGDNSAPPHYRRVPPASCRGLALPSNVYLGNCALLWRHHHTFLLGTGSYPQLGEITAEMVFDMRLEQAAGVAAPTANASYVATHVANHAHPLPL